MPNFKKRKNFGEQSDKVNRFNERHPVGTSVIVTLDDGAQVQTETRSEAWVIGGHTAVILLESISGAYWLDRVRPAAGETPAPEHEKSGRS